MKTQKIIIILSLLNIYCTIINAQIQYPGVPLSKNQILKLDVHTVTMPPINIDALLAEDMIEEQQKNIPYRFGYAHMVDLGIINSGTWDTLATGDKVWRIRIESAGAFSINLIFNRFYLPTGSSLFVYNEDKSMIIGAFTEKNNNDDSVFSTTPVKGDRILIEYNQPAYITTQPNINISVVVHAYKNILRMIENLPNDFGGSGPCHFNIACPEGESWRSQARGVAMVLLANNTRICSGSLINNVNNDGTPYFLTAYHCMTASQTNPSTWIFMFGYESATCPNPSQEPPTNKTISGSTFKAGNAATDFLLLQLSSIPPTSYNVYYSGWNCLDVAATSGAGIHHPRGDIKKISFSNSSYVSSNYSGTANSHWRVNWSQVSGKTAVTEPGSSGSPIFDQNKRIVGQLHGGPSYCNAPPDKLHDFYGKFSMSWDLGSSPSTRLKDWLDPQNTGATSIDGYDPIAQIQVIVDQKRSNDSRLLGTTVGHWNGLSFDDIVITSPPPRLNTSVGTREILKGYQQLITNPNEKYRVWERNSIEQLDSVENHRGFTIKIDDNNLTSRFHPTYHNITIKNSLELTSQSGGEIQFKDPWLIDYPDTQYNYTLRNRGMDAPFKQRPSPFYPDDTTSYDGDVYKGVFLNQSGPPLWTPPYYSVGAISPQPVQIQHSINPPVTLNHNFYFQNWSANPPGSAEFQDANALQTPVVFKQEGATVQANMKGTQLSNEENAFANNGQRKFVRTLNA